MKGPVPLASRASILAAVGAALGWWMFALRGALLFGAVGVAVAVAVGYAGARSPRLAAGVALLTAAILLFDASTLGWGGTDAPDGSRYKASPVGLSHVLTPHAPASDTADCGWYGASGYAQDCAVGDEVAFRRLQAVYPLVIVALVLGLAGAGLGLDRAPRARRMQRSLAAAVLLCAVGAVVLFAGSLRPALAALTELPVGVGGTLGTMEMSLAMLLALAAALEPGHCSVGG
ncbi:MAG TPA: hypothetical protein VF037_08810 [Gemmatimonadales bacterium]